MDTLTFNHGIRYRPFWSDAAQIESFCHNLSQNKSIQKLKAEIAFPNLETQILFCQSIHNLTELDLAGSNLGYNAAQNLASNLSKNKTLKKLSLKENIIKNEGVMLMLSAVAVNSTLEELDLSVSWQEEMLQGFPQQLDKGVYLNLADLLRKNQTLTRFVFDNIWINFGGDHLRLLTDALSENKTLTSLSLENCYLEDIDPICDLISKNNTLTEISLAWNSFKDSAVLKLLSILDTNTKIIKIDLTNNSHISDGLKRKLKDNSHIII